MSGVRDIAEGPVVAVITPSARPVGGYLSFEMSLDNTIAPRGSFVARVSGSDALAHGVNKTIQHLLEGEDPPRKFWFIDDDHEWDDVALMRLLKHEVPVVMALTLRKQPPFHLMGFTGHREMWDEKRRRVVREFKNLPWAEAGKGGLQRVENVGRGGLLVDADVFRRVPYPWFTLGQIDPEEPMEDIYFSELLNEAGIPMFVDTGEGAGPLGTGHTSSVTAFAYRYPPESPYDMAVELRWPNGKTIIFPMTQKAKSDTPAETAPSAKGFEQ